MRKLRQGEVKLFAQGYTARHGGVGCTPRKRESMTQGIHEMRALSGTISSERKTQSHGAGQSHVAQVIMTSLQQAFLLLVLPLPLIYPSRAARGSSKSQVCSLITACHAGSPGLQNKSLPPVWDTPVSLHLHPDLSPEFQSPLPKPAP